MRRSISRLRMHRWGAILHQFRCESLLHRIGTHYGGRDDCHKNDPERQSPAWTTEHSVAVSASPPIAPVFPVAPANVAATTMWAFTLQGSH